MAAPEGSPRQSDHTLMLSVICCLAVAGGKNQNLPTNISEKCFLSAFVRVTKVQTRPPKTRSSQGAFKPTSDLGRLRPTVLQGRCEKTVGPICVSIGFN